LKNAGKSSFPRCRSGFTRSIGAAVAIAAATFMAFAIIIALAAGAPNSLQFFEDIFPGFDLGTGGFSAGLLLKLAAGLLWAAAFGFLLGAFTGLIYNWRVQKYVVTHNH
jgi:hypothetical protein